MTLPRWHTIFTDALSSEKHPPYTLSTVLSTASGTCPRSRSVVHRGIISPNPSRPLLLTTTDIRTPKSHQLHSNTNCEATFWLSPLKVQFRIVASAYLLPHPSHPWHDSFPNHALVGDSNTVYDWETLRLNTYDSLSDILRASFVRPVPGSPIANYDEAKKWPQTAPKRGDAKGEEEKRIIDEALKNFALVVLDPIEVEFLELGPLPNRRTRWTKKGEQWEEQIVVP